MRFQISALHSKTRQQKQIQHRLIANPSSTSLLKHGFKCSTPRSNTDSDPDKPGNRERQK